jgi:hypothetical protein
MPDPTIEQLRARLAQLELEKARRNAVSFGVIQKSAPEVHGTRRPTVSPSKEQWESGIVTSPSVGAMKGSMSDQERCAKYTSMLKAYCSHCQGTERGTADNPRFSLREEYFDGYPVVEVLKNGGPVHRFDSNFRFGVRKAQMLLACVDLLREFCNSSDVQRLALKPRVVEDQRHGLRIRIQVEMHPDFEHSSGRTIDRPWLLLQGLPPDKDRIGLGTIKCRAICEVGDDLNRWLRSQGVLD